MITLSLSAVYALSQIIALIFMNIGALVIGIGLILSKDRNCMAVGSGILIAMALIYGLVIGNAIGAVQVIP